MVLLLWGIFFVFKKNNLPKKYIDSVKTVNHTVNNLSDNQVKKVVNKNKSNNKDLSKEKDNIKNKEIFKEKEEIAKNVNEFYLHPNTDLFEQEDNLRMELYDKFKSIRFIKYSFLASLRWDYTGLNNLINYYKIKFWKNILSWYKLYTYTFKLNQKIDNIIVNWKALKSLKDNKYVYKTYFPFNFNVIFYKDWCVPMVKKKIWYVSEWQINVNFTCVKMKTINCNSVNLLNIWKFKVDLSNICWLYWIKTVSYASLNNNIAKKLWYLDLPVFNKDGYKLLAQWFDSYWMPIIILKNKNWQIVHKCVPVYYKYKIKNKTILNHISVNRYFNAIYWQKNWFPWWWNLDLIRWIRYAGYQQIYDKTNWTFLTKYCYQF